MKKRHDFYIMSFFLIRVFSSGTIKLCVILPLWKD
nr:MAG TPA: hypothetical protein [Bacteriophage sp.]